MKYAEALIPVFGEEIIKKTAADEVGAWLYKFDSLEVDYGSH